MELSPAIKIIAEKIAFGTNDTVPIGATVEIKIVSPKVETVKQDKTK